MTLGTAMSCEHGMKVIILMIKLIIFKGKGDIRNCYGAVSMV